jgi:hypothetical protein
VIAAPPKQHLGVRVDPEMRAVLHEIATARGVTMADIVREWIGERLIAEGYLLEGVKNASN